MSYHIAVDHRSAPQIPSLFKTRIKKHVSHLVRYKCCSLLPQVRKYRIRSMETTLLARTLQGNKSGDGSAKSSRSRPQVTLEVAPMRTCSSSIAWRGSWVTFQHSQESELGWTRSTQGNGRGLPSVSYTMTILGIIKVTVHWQKVGYSGVLHNLHFTDGH